MNTEQKNVIDLIDSKIELMTVNLEKYPKNSVGWGDLIVRIDELKSFKIKYLETFGEKPREHECQQCGDLFDGEGDYCSDWCEDSADTMKNSLWGTYEDKEKD